MATRKPVPGFWNQFLDPPSKDNPQYGCCIHLLALGERFGVQVKVFEFKNNEWRQIPVEDDDTIQVEDMSGPIFFFERQTDLNGENSIGPTYIYSFCKEDPRKQPPVEDEMEEV